MLPPFLQEIRVAARSRYDLGHGVWREVNALILSWLYDRLRRFGFSEWPNHRKIKKPLCVGLRVPCHSPQLRNPYPGDAVAALCPPGQPSIFTFNSPTS